jgi:hypothetical protein
LEERCKHPEPKAGEIEVELDVVKLTIAISPNLSVERLKDTKGSHQPLFSASTLNLQKSAAKSSGQSLIQLKQYQQIA